jgi:hypothetical protein
MVAIIWQLGKLGASTHYPLQVQVQVLAKSTFGIHPTPSQPQSSSSLAAITSAAPRVRDSLERFTSMWRGDSTNHDNHSVAFASTKSSSNYSTTVKQILRRLGKLRRPQLALDISRRITPADAGKVKMLRGSLGVAPQPSAISHTRWDHVYMQLCTGAKNCRNKRLRKATMGRETVRRFKVHVKYVPEHVHSSGNSSTGPRMHHGRGQALPRCFGRALAARQRRCTHALPRS